MSISFSFNAVKKQPTGLAAKPKVQLVFGDDDEDGSSEDEGRDMVSRRMQAQTEKNERLVKEAEEKAEEENPGLFDYDKNYEEMLKRKTAVEKAKRENAKSGQAKWIGDMKNAANQREKERELTDIRMIQKEAETTNQFYTEIDQEVAPIVTSAYRRKIQEQKEQAEKDAERDIHEKRHAVERTGFGSFNANLLAKLTETEVTDEKPEDEYQKELEGLIFKRDQQQKKDRREKYLKLKRDQRSTVFAEEAEAEEREEKEAQQKAEEAKEDTAKEEPEVPEATEDKEEEEEGEGEDCVTATSTTKTIEKLAYLDEHRKKIVRENRVKRAQRRNTEEDLEKAKLRYLKRKGFNNERA